MSFLDEYPKQNNLRTGYMGNLTERQQSEFDLLKASVKTNEYIDELNVFPQPGWFILRFLRATMKDKTGLRIFQAVPAEERLIGTLKWRRENNTSQIRDNLRNNKLPATFETYLRDIRPRMTWIDKSGRPVTLEKLGLYAQHVQLDVFTEKEWEVNCIYDLERILLTFDEQSALLGVEVGTKITIFDLDGIGLGAVSRIKILKMLSAMMGTHYPELAGPILALNAPYIFTQVYALASVFLDANTKHKVVITDKFDLELLGKILSDVSKHIPKEYGDENPESPTLCIHVPK